MPSKLIRVTMFLGDPVHGRKVVPVSRVATMGILIIPDYLIRSHFLGGSEVLNRLVGPTISDFIDSN